MLNRYLVIVVLVSLVVLVTGCGKVEPTDTPVLPTATAVSPTNTATPEPSNTATLEPTDTVTPEPSSTPTPTLGIGSAATREADGMELIHVPGGTFLMGSEDGHSNEQPMHSVTLDSFWIDRTQVSNAQYALCIC